MKPMHVLPVVAGFCFLMAVQAGGQTVSIQIAPAEYEGLKPTSYGPMVDYRNQSTGKLEIEDCDPDLRKAQEGPHFFSGLFDKFLKAPLNNTAKQAEKFYHPDLPGKGEERKPAVMMTSAPEGSVQVVALERRKDRIVLWHDVIVVPLEEAILGANAYCQAQNPYATAVYDGSARHCGQPMRMPVALNGKQFTIPTYAISRFQCVAPKKHK